MERFEAQDMTIAELFDTASAVLRELNARLPDEGIIARRAQEAFDAYDELRDAAYRAVLDL